MEIPILTWLKHLLLLIGCYLMTYYFYKKILHSEYRWSQKGNICYNEARWFGIIVGGILFFIIELIINNQVNFTFN